MVAGHAAGAFTNSTKGVQERSKVRPSERSSMRPREFQRDPARPRQANKDTVHGINIA